MKSNLSFGLVFGTMVLAVASVAFAGGTPNGGPAPLLGAGLPGLAILAAAGGGYIALRLRRRDRD
jgi:hypothetical protein